MEPSKPLSWVKGGIPESRADGLFNNLVQYFEGHNIEREIVFGLNPF
ncbi:hypothetical protein [Vibrio rarus]|nr:hypothetical protein [Vibrio rarus]